jgi:hypothetical protein
LVRAAAALPTILPWESNGRERTRAVVSPIGKEERCNSIVNPRFTLADKPIFQAVI